MGEGSLDSDEITHGLCGGEAIIHGIVSSMEVAGCSSAMSQAAPQLRMLWKLLDVDHWFYWWFPGIAMANKTSYVSAKAHGCWVVDLAWLSAKFDLFPMGLLLLVRWLLL